MYSVLSIMCLFSNSLSSISLLSFGLKGVFHITMLEVINGLFPYLFM